MITVNINQGKGVLALPDGRTMKLNGLGMMAQLSDGSEIYVGGFGPLYVPDMTDITLSLMPTSGSSGTTAHVTVSSGNPDVPATPKGTAVLYINGTEYSQATLAEGAANFVLASEVFPSPGAYNIQVQYTGSESFSPVYSTTEVFTATGG